MSPPRGTLSHIHRLRVEVNRLIDLLLEEPSTATASWDPPVDLIERDAAFEVRVELPGVRPEDIQIELCDQALTIRGAKRRPANEPPGRTFHLMERFIGSFQLSMELPRPIMPNQCTAKLVNGLLVVNFPKAVERRHRSFVIPVKEDIS